MRELFMYVEEKKRIARRNPSGGCLAYSALGLGRRTSYLFHHAQPEGESEAQSGISAVDGNVTVHSYSIWNVQIDLKT